MAYLGIWCLFAPKALYLLHLFVNIALISPVLEGFGNGHVGYPESLCAWVKIWTIFALALSGGIITWCWGAGRHLPPL